MVIKKGQHYDVEINGIAFGGKGLTKIDRLAVFVEHDQLRDDAAGWPAGGVCGPGITR